MKKELIGRYITKKEAIMQMIHNKVMHKIRKQKINNINKRRRKRKLKKLKRILLRHLCLKFLKEMNNYQTHYPPLKLSQNNRRFILRRL